MDVTLQHEVTDLYKRLSQGMPNFRNRASQRQMIGAVARSLSRGPGHTLAVEAPTGTGKSLAYLTGAAPVARAAGKKLVVATSTIALQNQLVQRDIPAWAALTGQEVRILLAKGRQRYFCPLKGEKATGVGQAQQDLLADVAAPGEGASPVALTLVEAFHEGRWQGDRDQWPEAIPDPEWRKLTASRHGCLGTGCRYRATCPVVRAREALQSPQQPGELVVVVTNHDLLLADLALGAGVILPEPADAFYVLDEAHDFARAALSHFGSGASLEGARRSLRAVENIIRQLGGCGSNEMRALIAPVQLYRKGVESAVRALEQVLLQAARESGQRAGYELVAQPGGQRMLRWIGGRPSTAARDEARAISAALEEVLKAAQKARTLARKLSTAGYLPQAVVEGLLGDLGDEIETLERLLETARSWGKDLEHSSGPPDARWAMLAPGGYLGGEQVFHVSIETSPVNVAGYLRTRLWAQAAGAVLTSATLTSLGEFGLIQSEMGLPDVPQGEYMRVESPFDHSRSVLCVPNVPCEPSEEEEHTRYVIEALPGLIEPGVGTLVLFTSRRQMEAVHAGLHTFWRDAVLRQGDLPHAELLRQHAERIQAGTTSVIFGLASFAQGVDLPGDLCRHLVVVKLPFSVPDNPAEATMAEYLKERGQNPFATLFLPQASLRLVQAVGRLVRTETDEGRVTVLDTRLVQRAYGQRLLDALPPFRRDIRVSRFG